MIDRPQWANKVIELAPWDGEVNLNSAVFHVNEKVKVAISPPYNPIVYPYPSVHIWYDPQPDVQYTAYKEIKSKNIKKVMKEAVEFYNDFARRFRLEVVNNDY